MSGISAAVIGLGYWGPNILRNAIEIGGFESIYGYDSNSSMMEKNKKRFFLSCIRKALFFSLVFQDG